MDKKENKKLIEKVKEKKELARLPTTIVKRALEKTKGDIKEARAQLRKYYGMFLTNKVLKRKGEEALTSHISSKERNYKTYYKNIFEDIQETKTVIDFGAGANGYTIQQLRNIIGPVTYIGIEAAGQLVENTNTYYKENNIQNAKMIHEDLHKTKKILETITKTPKPRTALILQIIDALETEQKDYTKTLLKTIKPHFKYLIISLPTRSIGGKKGFNVQRTWLINFLKKEYDIEKDYKERNERMLIIKNKEV